MRLIDLGLIAFAADIFSQCLIELEKTALTVSSALAIIDFEINVGATSRRPSKQFIGPKKV